MSDTTHPTPAPALVPGAEPPETLTGIKVSKPARSAAGLTAVLSSMNHIGRTAGLLEGTKALMNLNQLEGFDCPSCAWPDPADHRAASEFCENGAKAIASEATRKRITRDFFESYSVQELSRQSDYWLDQQGRLTEPMILRDGATHYEPLSWDEAFTCIATELTALPSPDDAYFYTSGRASNEAAFLYQLFARHFGTNNLPDCSNMCHESSGAALNASIGVGKGTVSLEDLHEAEVLLLVGQNPGTNHPRMLSSLQENVRRGGTIIAINPLLEAGMLGFKHPQEISGLLGFSTPLASHYLQVRLNGDFALFRGFCKALLEQERATPGVLDKDFLDTHTTGFAAWRDLVEQTDWPAIVTGSGISEQTIRDTAAIIAKTKERKIITCWAMGLTQHENAVPTIQEVVHFHLMLGAIGKPGAGLCPVRGHSNVQGDRTMGIFEKMPAWFLDKLEEVFGVPVPRHEGADTVAAIRAMHDSPGKVFLALGGNFLSATPDTHYTARAMAQCRLTAQISTKLNRSHLVTGRTGLILPCLGRSEIDLQQGIPQFVTVENSMSVVHQSRGVLEPGSPHLRSETAIIAGIAHAVLGEKNPVPWLHLAADYDKIRDLIEKIVPGFDDFNERIRVIGGFTLRNTASERTWATPSAKAVFHARPLRQCEAAKGQLLLQTLRSHDQFNTTIYGLNDRYRGIGGERRIIFLNPSDLKNLGLRPLQPVDITSHWKGVQRVAHHFLAVPYDIPQGSAAAYFPEANVLIPVDSVAEESHTPTSKSIAITVAPSRKIKTDDASHAPS
jgi:molybdopterin-dependent oxidoreductase alpha subunit